jgi:hypothetical protein
MGEERAEGRQQPERDEQCHAALGMERACEPPT